MMEIFVMLSSVLVGILGLIVIIGLIALALYWAVDRVSACLAVGGMIYDWVFRNKEDLRKTWWWKLK